MKEPYFSVERDFKGDWKWYLRDSSDIIVAESEKAYKMLAKCTASISIAKETMKAAGRIDIKKSERAYA
jgi:uncharacterized protein YegP (UPF0339 family)